MDKKEIRQFFDMLAPTWDAGQKINESKIARILDAAGVRAGLRVLDAACGTGVLFPYYLQRECAEIVGVDISPVMCEIAAQKFIDERIRVLNADLEKLSHEEAAICTKDFDCCVIYNAFPHFPDPQGLINGIAALLKNGGRLTIAHSMGREQINAHHSGSAAKVSMGLLPAEETAALFAGEYIPDIVLEEDELYIVSGIKKY